MNRLKGLACYLSGPIQDEVNFGREWREEITPFLEAKNVTVFNPLKPIFHGTAFLNETKRPHMNHLVQEENWEDLRTEVKEINKWDLRAVDLSSFLIVNYNNDVHMCGTYEELFLANTQNKPVLMVVKDKKKLPLWMYGRIPTRSHMFVGWDSLKDYLTRIDTDPNFQFDPADKKRWLFFFGFSYDLTECGKDVTLLSMKDYRADFGSFEHPIYNEEDIVKIKSLYLKHFGREASDDTAKDIFKMYNYHCQQLITKLATHVIIADRKDRHGRRKLTFDDFKRTCWTEFEDLEDYIKGEKEDADERKAQAEAMNAYMALPWWQRELGEKGEDPYWQNVSKSFLASNLYTELCSYWNFQAEQIKQIAVWYNDNHLHLACFNPEEFTKEPGIMAWCNGICADGGRVFRTAISVFFHMHSKYGVPFLVGKTLKKD